MVVGHLSKKFLNSMVFLYSLHKYRVSFKSVARPTSRCILFVGENISFDASLVLYIYIYIQGVPGGM